MTTVVRACLTGHDGQFWPATLLGRAQYGEQRCLKTLVFDTAGMLDWCDDAPTITSHRRSLMLLRGTNCVQPKSLERQQFAEISVRVSSSLLMVKVEMYFTAYLGGIGRKSWAGCLYNGTAEHGSPRNIKIGRFCPVGIQQQPAVPTNLCPIRQQNYGMHRDASVTCGVGFDAPPATCWKLDGMNCQCRP